MFKRFLSLFMVLAIILCTFAACDTADKDDEKEEESVEFDYEYHLEMYGLSKSSYNYLKYYKSENGVFDEAKELYVITDTVEYERDGVMFYDIKIRFCKEKNIDDYAKVAQYYNSFVEYYIPKLDTLEENKLRDDQIKITERLQYALDHSK